MGAAAPSGQGKMTAPGAAAGSAKVVAISERPDTVRDRWRSAACEVADRAFANADRYDGDGAYPFDDVAALQESRLLSAVMPREFGGERLAGSALCDVLRQIGSGSLPLGRLYEGHVNALGLVLRYGSREQVLLVAKEAGEGRLYGVWNTDDRDGLRLVVEHGRYRLAGRKILASGAGHIGRPIVTASDADGGRYMVMPRLPVGERADLSQWTAHGMRASATGSVDFSGLPVEAIEIIGSDGDYQRQPAFSGGAWRFAAVQLGGMERLFDCLRTHLRLTGRGGNPHQASRVGEAALAVETARLWVERAAAVAEGPSQAGGDRIVAYVNLARLAVERAGLDLMELVHRSVGLQAFIRPNPIERISRDLATYLRQPGPDQALTSAAAWVLEQEAAAADVWSC
jgi:alkylation response protein AidB-like acyl-CoA dehydrogenase